MAFTLFNTRLRMTQAKYFGKYNVASGTVTSITAGAGITLTPNPLITTGTVEITAPVTVPLGGTGQTTFGVGYVLFGDAANSIKSDSELFWNNTLKYLGVGGSPSYPLTVVDTVGTTGVDNYASFHSLVKNGAEPATNSVGLYGGVTLNLAGGATVANFAGVASRVRVINAGTGTSGANFTAVAGVEDTATWNSRVGYYLYDATVAAGAALTDQYGVYIPQLSAASSNNYAIFTAGTTPSFFNGNIRTGGNAAVDGSLGVGTPTPSYPVHVQKSVGATGADTSNIYSAMTVTAADANVRNAYTATVTASHVAGTVGGIVGYYGILNATGNGGTTSNSIGLFVNTTCSVGHTIAERKGVYINDWAGAGTVTEQFGVKVEQLSKAGTNWAIFTEGTTPSKFEGPVLLTDMVTVGHTSTPTREVDIEGTTRYRGIAAPAVSEANSCTIYFDAGLNNLRASVNGSAYVNIMGSGGVTGTGVATKLASWSGLTSLEGTANLYVDTTNHRLGVKVAAPAYPLDVDGDINITTGSVIRVNALKAIVSDAADDITLLGSSLPAAPGANTTAIGALALALTTATGNTSVGRNSLGATTTGQSNVALGMDAGQTNTTGNDNLFLGTNADAGAGNLQRATAIGHDAIVATNDAMVLGDTAVKVGIHTSTPAQALDVNGAVATRHLDIILVNGANTDIALTDSSWIRFTGPTGAFSINGFTGGTDGRRLTVFNTTTQAMTITNLATSGVNNQIDTLTGGDVVLAARKSSATFIYEDASDKWILVGWNG